MSDDLTNPNDSAFDELGRRAGRALQEPAPEGGVSHITDRGRRQQTVKVAVACVGIIAAVAGGLALLATDTASGKLQPATSSTTSEPTRPTTTSEIAPPPTTIRTTTTVPIATESTTDGKPRPVSLVAPSGRTTTFTPGPQVGTSFAAFSTGANVEFSADGATLAVVTGSTMRLYNASDLTLRSELPCPVAGQQVAPEWTSAARSLITAINAHSSITLASCHVSFSRNGRMAAAGNIAWDTRTGRSVSLPGDDASISPDGTTVVTAGGDGIRVWNASTGALVEQLDPAHPCPTTGDCTSPDGSVSTATFDRDGLHIVGSGRAGLTLWDARTRRKQLEIKTRNAFSVVFAAKNRRVVTATFDGISLWDATSGAELLHAQGFSECFNAAASQDATLLATAGVDGAPLVVDAVSGVSGSLQGPVYGQHLVDLAFSPDGTRLAVAADTGIQIWLVTH